jgi:Glycosyl transferase family 2
MDKPFISYLVTTKNGTNQLKDLLQCIARYIDGNECVILDDYSDNIDTIDILNYYKNKEGFSVYKHALNNHYSNHKNHGKDLCVGKYIFQLDDDELPNDVLMSNIKDIILSNPSVECFLIPRINDFIGVTETHARQWGWHLSEYDGRYIVNYPDYQYRLFRNLPHIKWERPLHEKIEGALVTSKLPPEFELSIVHNKTIEKQVATNLRYNKDFSEELNKGFKI